MDPPSLCIVANPHAGSWPGPDALAPLLAGRPRSRLDLTAAPGHGGALARQAVEEGFDVVVAAGGDGTISEVLDGLVRAFFSGALGILPLGTGNDLARTLGIPTPLEAAMAAIRADRRRRLDLLHLTGPDGLDRYGINASVGGLASEVTSELSEATKRLLGPLAFVASSLLRVGEIRVHEVDVRWDDAAAERHQAVALVVANGRTAGGGRHLAPQANPEDGLLDVVLVHPGTAVAYADIAARLVAGDYTRHPGVIHRQARRLALTADPPMAFNLDGEPVAATPLHFEAAPQRLDVIVGEAYDEEGSGR